MEKVMTLVSHWSKRAAVAASLLTLIGGTSAWAAGPAEGNADLTNELQALRTRIQQLEAKENENWLTEERANQIKSIVQEVIADSKTRGTFADGPDIGYKDGFYIQTADKNFKLVIGGFVQFRYTYAYQHASATGANATTPFASIGTNNQQNANGFDIRRARVNFSGNAFSPDIFFKLEGDFYGASNGSNLTGASANGAAVQTTSASGNFSVTDAYIGYVWSDQIKVRAGAFKAPFTKAELMSDTKLAFMERPEENTPFDAQRSIGLSLFGDIQKDTLGYEVNVNNGSNSNYLRRADTNNTFGTGTPSSNYDNRLAFYGRVNWAGAGKISDIFAGESDLRKDNRDFVWMLGAAGGYESQNSDNAAFSQATTTVNGISSSTNGFTNYVLNGDVFKGTVDWSGKWQGWSVNTAAYFQQVNANHKVADYTTSATTLAPFDTDKGSFFQHGYYGQIGYMIVPQKFEVLGRAGAILTEGNPSIGDYYTLGANYYLFGNNARLAADVTYSPEAAYTDAGDASIQNTHEVILKLQLQLAF